jgi:hypothetical protein
MRETECYGKLRGIRVGLPTGRARRRKLPIPMTSGHKRQKTHGFGAMS